MFTLYYNYIQLAYNSAEPGNNRRADIFYQSLTFKFYSCRFCAEVHNKLCTNDASDRMSPCPSHWHLSNEMVGNINFYIDVLFAVWTIQVWHYILFIYLFTEGWEADRKYNLRIKRNYYTVMHRGISMYFCVYFHRLTSFCVIDQARRCRFTADSDRSTNAIRRI